MSTSVSTRLVSLRKEKNLSQKEAAIELGVSQALLSHYEKGIRECSLDFVVKVSRYYGVSCDYLLGLTEKSPENDGIARVLSTVLSTLEKTGDAKSEKYCKKHLTAVAKCVIVGDTS